MKTGILLANLGTPDAPTTPAVRKYLAEFLMDEDVVDIHPFLRFLLVYGAILPTRPAKSAEAYAKVWTERGSPLMFHSQDLARKVSARLGAGHHVALGMRYGQPSLRQALEELRAARVDRVVLLPLYPQYSLAATESSIKKTRAEFAKMKWAVPLEIKGDFHDHPLFIEAFAQVAAPVMARVKPDFTLFSFHGLPERQVHRVDPTGRHCLASAHCCDRIDATNRYCYRAQSFATARKIAVKLGLAPEQYAVSFQSRLGRTPWIKPYTDYLYKELGQKGVKRLAVLSPSFVADCLETLEEIEMRGREDFRRAGGEELHLVPSLNASDAWVECVADLVRAR